MHVSGHMKPLGHEAHGSTQVGGTRKKPQKNPDEVGPVKDHFSQGRQQRNDREPPRKISIREPEATAFEDATPPHLQVSPTVAQAVSSIHTLLIEAAPNAHSGEPTPEPSQPAAQPREQSLDDLLALMCAKP